MCESATTPEGRAAQGNRGEGQGTQAGPTPGMGNQGGGGGQAQWAGAQAAPQAPPMAPAQGHQSQMPQPWYTAPTAPYPGYAAPVAPPYPGAPWGYGPPPAPWPPQPYYPYPPAAAMGPVGQAPHAGQGAGRAVHAAGGGTAPFGPGFGQGPGQGSGQGSVQGAGMARMLDEMTGDSGLGNLVRMLDLDDRELWKGALIGAAAVLLLTNDSVQNALFRSGVRARDAVKAGVDQVRTRTAAVGESVRRAREDAHE